MPRYDNKDELYKKFDRAICSRNIPALKECLKNGADPNIRLPGSSLIPLYLAEVFPSCVGVIHELLNHGARYDFVSDQGRAFIHYITSRARPGNEAEQILDEILKIDVKVGHFWTLQITIGEHKGKTPVDVLTKSMREYYEITPEDIVRGKDPKTHKTLLPQDGIQKNIIWDIISSFWHRSQSDTCATEIRTIHQKHCSPPAPNPTPTTEKIKAD